MTLPAPRLTDTVVAALAQGGLRILAVEGDRSPFVVTVEDVRGAGRHRLRAYVRNITHGGATRADDEYRIQITDREILVDGQHLTLLLGYHPGTEVFAAFDPLFHQEYGASPSVQIPFEEMAEASTAGVVRTFSRPRREGDEPVAVFPAEFLADYVRARGHLRAAGTEGISADESEAVLSGSLSETEEETHGDRERALVQTAQFIRDRLFALRVLRAYGRRCAFCGINAHLVDAAHIVPVHRSGLDSVRNGMALCPTHHRAFDEGVITVDERYAIRVDETILHARGGTTEDRARLLAGVGERIRLPDDRGLWPVPDWLRERGAEAQ